MGWKIEIRWLAGVLVPALLLGQLLGWSRELLILSLVVLLVRHLGHLARLTLLLRGGAKLRPPYPGGLWGEVFRRLSWLQKGSRRRKRRLSRFFSRFREAVAVLPEAIVILGERDEVAWCNPSARHMLGIHWPRDAGRQFTALVRHPILDEYLSKGVFQRPLELPSPENKAIMLSLYVTSFGKQRQRLLVARDVTRVYHLDHARRDFVANVSHELRTPLTVISGFLESLRDTAGDGGDEADGLRVMEEQAHRMRDLIDDLLTLSRLEMEACPGAGAPVPVPQLLTSIVATARRLSGPAAHDIQVQADERLWLRGDPDELRSAFSNLVFNAVRHTPPRSRVLVTWDTDAGGGARLCVSDSGGGIPARHVPRLTERFYRVDPGRSRDSGGTGLGLAIVKHVLTRHDGELQIASEEGKGASFTCLFPASRVAHSHGQRAEMS